MRKVLMMTWAMTIIVFSACSDDNLVEPTPVSDKGTWYVDDTTMDTIVRPGDDFYMYCNGGFWQTATVDESQAENNSWFFVDLPKLMEQRMAAVPIPSAEKMKADVARTDEATVRLQQARLQSALNRVSAIASPEEAWRLMAQLMKEGYRMPLWLAAFPKQGHIAAMLWFDESYDFSYMMSRGDNQPAALLDQTYKHPKWRFSLDAKVLASLRPLSSDTRVIDTMRWPMLATIFQELDIPLTHAYAIESVPEYEGYVEWQQAILSQMQDLDVNVWKDYLAKILSEDAVFFDPSALDALNQSQSSQLTFEDIANGFGEIYLVYEKSRVFADAYVTSDMKQRTRAICEEIRQTFHNHIARNDWMSEGTKLNAGEKLDAMTFNVGYPDEWIEDGVPDLSHEATFFDDVLTARRSNLNLTRRLIGMQTAEASFHMMILAAGDLTTVNAFYEPTLNAMNIYPTWMMEPCYSQQNNEAHNYATYAVIGHEITHGFDNIGSHYNKLGDLEDIWTSDADRQEFERRAQLLADCYSGLEVMPWALPGLYADGAYTLGENIADLGGFDLVYETYLRHLRDRGFTGEQFDLQRQRFYMAYAWLWHGRYTAKFAQMYINGDENGNGKNVHSLFRERVNGVVMNTDDWYNLFPVDNTNELYRAPENRVRIW